VSNRSENAFRSLSDDKPHFVILSKLIVCEESFYYRLLKILRSLHSLRMTLCLQSEGGKEFCRLFHFTAQQYARSMRPDTSSNSLSLCIHPPFWAPIGSIPTFLREVDRCTPRALRSIYISALHPRL